MRARDIMTSPVITAAPDLPIHDAANLLARRGFTALPVVDEDDRLTGLVTEADLIRERIAVDPRIHGYTEPRARSRRIPVVADIMTTSVESFTPGVDIAAAMIAERVRCFPIVDGRRLVGVITRRDLLTAAVSHLDADRQCSSARPTIGLRRQGTVAGERAGRRHDPGFPAHRT